MTDSETGNITDRDLEAFVDGQFAHDPARKAAIEAYIAGNPEARRKVESLRAIARRIRTEYDDVLQEPVPGAMTDILLSERPPRHWRIARRGTATAALAAVLVLSWWVGHSRLLIDDTDKVADRFFQSYRHTAAVLEERDRDWEVRTGDLGPALMQPSLKLPTPDLSGLGYDLSGSETTQRDGEAMTKLIYEDREGDVITILLEKPPAAKQTPPKIEKNGNVEVAYWKDGPLTIAVVGDRIERNIDEIVRAIDQSFKDMKEDGQGGKPTIAETLKSDGRPEQAIPSADIPSESQGMGIQ